MEYIAKVILLYIFIPITLISIIYLIYKMIKGIVFMIKNRHYSNYRILRVYDYYDKGGYTSHYVVQYMLYGVNINDDDNWVTESDDFNTLEEAKAYIEEERRRRLIPKRPSNEVVCYDKIRFE